MADEPTLLTPAPIIPAALEPLRASWEADDVEADMKASFLAVFEAMIRPRLQRINAHGMPHLAPFETLQRSLKAEGLVLERKSDGEPLMRELFRGWRARNPRRGLHFLRYYLQLLFPGQWRAVQLWQHPSQPYPSGASETQADGSYLTSRVRVTLTSDETTGDEMQKLFGSLRAALGAKYVLELVIERSTGASASLRMAAGADIVAIAFYEGTAAR